MKRWFAMLAALLLLAPAAAQAQLATVEVKFVGMITGSAADTLMINGQKWTGPLPDFPYKAGDQITVSMNVRPSGEYLDPNYPSKPVDGIYRFSVIGASQLQNFPSATAIAPITAMDVSGPISAAGGIQTSQGLVMTYNSNSGTWGMEMPTGSYSLFQFDGPGYLYDPASDSLSLTSTTRDPVYGCTDQGSGCFGLSGSMTDSAIRRAPVYGTDGSTRGFFSMLFSGDWFVNGVKQGGGSTEVPEPGQLGMMALALLPLIARRRRRLARA